MPENPIVVTANTPRLLRLSPRDNVAVATANIPAGNVLEVEGNGPLRVCEAITIGHKVAVVPIRRAEKIVKFGCPIGSATIDVAAGQHVHTHNVRSDYIPTFILEPGHV